MQALIRLYEGSIKALLRLYCVTCMAYMLAATLWSIGPPASVSRPRTRLVLRLYSDSITALLRLYQGSITDLLKLYYGSAGPSHSVSRPGTCLLPSQVSMFVCVSICTFVLVQQLTKTIPSRELT